MTPRPALAATIAASMLVLGATGALAAGSPQLTGRAPDKTSPTTAPVVAPTTTVPAPTTSAAPTTTSAHDLHDGRRPDRRSARSSTSATPSRSASTTRTSPTALADIQAWWAQEFPRLYGEPFTPLAGGIFAAYPERTLPDPRMRVPRQHELPGGQRLRGVLLPRRRLHGLRRRRARRHLRARRAVQPVGGRRRDGPRVRPRRAVPHRAPSSATCRRSTRSSRPTASPGRGRGGSGMVRLRV